MATVVTAADALDPVLNQGFVEYAQARGFVIDPARVRSPQDKARVERAVQFVQSSFWAGEDFGCLGLRIHRGTQRQPAVVFAEHEAPVLLAAPVGRYDLPIYRSAKVHRDHHIEVAKSLYSVPGDLIGTHVEVTADSKLVKIFSSGRLVKVHPRQKPGGRATDPADLPSALTDYAMRDIDSQRRQGAARGPNIGAFVDVVLDGPLPWTRMRHVYKLFRTCDRYGNETVDVACERAVDAGATNVNTVIAMIERALEAAAAAADPVPDNVITGRFARNADHFSAGKARP
jgi:hypothetical protein